MSARKPRRAPVQLTNPEIQMLNELARHHGESFRTALHSAIVREHECMTDDLEQIDRANQAAARRFDLLKLRASIPPFALEGMAQAIRIHAIAKAVDEISQSEAIVDAPHIVSAAHEILRTRGMLR